MSLVSEYKFPYQRPFTPFSEGISDDPDRFFFLISYLISRMLLHVLLMEVCGQRGSRRVIAPSPAAPSSVGARVVDHAPVHSQLLAVVGGAVAVF